MVAVSVSGPEAAACTAVRAFYSAAGVAPPVVVICDRDQSRLIRSGFEGLARRSWIRGSQPVDHGWRTDSMASFFLLLVSAATVLAWFPSPVSAAGVVACMVLVCLIESTQRTPVRDQANICCLVLLAALAAAGTKVAARGLDRFLHLVPDLDTSRHGYVEIVPELAVFALAFATGTFIVKGLCRDLRQVWSWRRTMSWVPGTGMNLPGATFPSVRLSACAQSLKSEIAGHSPGGGTLDVSVQTRDDITLAALAVKSKHSGGDLPLLADKASALFSACQGFELRTGVATVWLRDREGQPVLVFPSALAAEPFHVHDVPVSQANGNRDEPSGLGSPFATLARA